MKDLPRSIALQQYNAKIRSTLSKQAQLANIETRLRATIVLYENETEPVKKNILVSDVYHLNSMFRDTTIAIAQEILGVNKRYSIRGIGNQFAQLCRTIHFEEETKEAASIRLKPYIAAWHILSSFPTEDLTMFVE